MIFATVGTHHDGFPRMLRALELLPPDTDLVVQHGNGEAPANARMASPFLPFSEMSANFAAADIVLTHAGVGSILLAIQHGHVPIVFPRLKRHGEHVDDHQLELAEQMSARALVRVVWEAEELPEAVRQTPHRGPGVRLPQTGLHLAVHAALRGDSSPAAG